MTNLNPNETSINGLIVNKKPEGSKMLELGEHTVNGLTINGLIVNTETKVEKV